MIVLLIHMVLFQIGRSLLGCLTLFPYLSPFPAFSPPLFPRTDFLSGREGGGIGIIALAALMLTLALRSSEVHLSTPHKQRGTLLVLVSSLCCVLILSGSILWSHASQASSRPAGTPEVLLSRPSPLPTPSPQPRPTPSPTPFPVLTPSTAQVLTTWCAAINRQDTMTTWQQYSPQMQQLLLANQAQTAQAQYQRKIVHCTANDLNERSAVGDLMLTTINGNGNGDGMERPYQLTLSVENHAWKITHRRWADRAVIAPCGRKKLR